MRRDFVAVRFKLLQSSLHIIWIPNKWIEFYQNLGKLIDKLPELYYPV
jgi:hypothetical protein